MQSATATQPLQLQQRVCPSTVKTASSNIAVPCAQRSRCAAGVAVAAPHVALHMRLAGRCVRMASAAPDAPAQAKPQKQQKQQVRMGSCLGREV